MPSSSSLFPELANHCQSLKSQPVDGLSARLQTAALQLGQWIHKRRVNALPANIIIVCTGNSRRSILGSTMGNVAAAWLELANVRFYSGGTEPSAFNPRTIQALRAIGVQVTELEERAQPGAPGESNPRYLVQWGNSDEFQSVEFSKHYADTTNPQADFCAVMVCSEAADHCPVVLGADQRIPMPFDDPKEFDGTSSEPAMYAARRDQIGRAMLLALTSVN